MYLAEHHPRPCAECGRVSRPGHEPAEVAEVDEGHGVVDVVQHGEEQPAEDALQEAAGDEDALGAEARGVRRKERGEEQGGQVVDAKDKAILQACNIFCRVFNNYYYLQTCDGVAPFCRASVG